MLKPGTRVLVVSNMYPHEKNVTYGIFVKETLDMLKQTGLETDFIFLKGRGTPIKYAFGVVKLWRQLLRKRYDLIHAYYVYSGVVARMQLVCPVIVTLCGSDVNLSFQRQISRLLCRTLSGTIVQSQRMKALLGHDAAVIIPFGVNLSLFKPIPQSLARSKLQLETEARYALFPYDPSRKEKRYELFARALNKAQKEVPGLQQLVLKGLPRELVPLYMAAADVMVLTSVQEGSPTTVKEALACALPVVSVDVGDVAEQITGVEGCAVCDAAEDAIAEGIIGALSSRRRTEASNRVKAMSAEETAKKLVAYYDMILGR